MAVDFEGKTASMFSFKLNYESVTKIKYKEEIILYMNELKGRYQLGKPHLYAIAKSLEKIKRNFGLIASWFKRIKTDYYSSQDRQKEKEEGERRYVEHKEACTKES